MKISQKMTKPAVISSIALDSDEEMINTDSKSFKEDMPLANRREKRNAMKKISDSDPYYSS